MALQNEGYASSIVPLQIRGWNFLNHQCDDEYAQSERVFHGRAHSKFQQSFQVLYFCHMDKQLNVTDEAIQLWLFPFSLIDDTLDWLEVLPSESIYT